MYRENEKRPSKYAKATVEFIKQENVNVSIKGYIDFYNVHFDSAYEFEGADIFLDYLSDQSKSMSVLYRTQIS